MRIYNNGYQLMSEMGRDIWEMGIENHANSYQNKDTKDDPDFDTKELILKSYTLTDLPDEDELFKFSKSQAWAEMEFGERISPVEYHEDLINPGNAWKLRRQIWEQFLNRNKEFDYTYHERFHEFIEAPCMKEALRINPGEPASIYRPIMNIIIHQLKTNPGTRQAILPIFRASDLGNMGGIRRIPCSMYYIFMLRKIKGQMVLSMSYHQRSSDFVTHFGNDVYLAWRMKTYIADQLQVFNGNLYHVIDSLHCYRKDWDKLKGSL